MRSRSSPPSCDGPHRTADRALRALRPEAITSRWSFRCETDLCQGSGRSEPDSYTAQAPHAVHAG